MDIVVQHVYRELNTMTDGIPKLRLMGQDVFFISRSLWKVLFHIRDMPFISTSYWVECMLNFVL